MKNKVSAYDHKKIESKWRKVWAKNKLNQTKDNYKKPKFYILDMFPYPSGAGLHVGHPRGFIATDVYSRYKRMHGFNVLHPMGWDAFGLPAENFAIKNKTNPADQTKINVKRYKEQTSILGFNYDWDREINTTDPKYYKWTQWIFLKLLEKGLAYESFEPINWCPSCKTGLALEDLEDGKCERCESVVEKKPMRQWVLKITDYADRLLTDLDTLNWPESIKESQRNWIGRSEGSEFDFKIKNSDQKITVFTTRADTLFGVTYVVLAPENKLVDELKSQIKNWPEVEKFRAEVKAKTEIERTAENKPKTGVALKGVTVINPANNEEVPVWIADYVLNDYGTGAVMAVPAHDERDFQFANKYKLLIKNVISPYPGSPIQSFVGKDVIKTDTTDLINADTDKVLTGELVWIRSGTLRNSNNFNGLSTHDARKEITKAFGRVKVSYKLKDWVFSRQRYWGEPIPVIHCEKCGVVPVPEKDLPVVLPKVKSYEPTGTGESPLAGIDKWVNTKCPKCKGKARRETNTMPQWAGSSWYYLRYMDPKNNQALVSEKKEKYWAPVDLYVGGTEHATRHLIYARFWHKFLFDIGVVSTKEPFSQLKNQGMILGSDSRKMSKRWGNVVNPDEVVNNVGADTLRVYEMFMGPFEQEIAWSTDNMVGSRRFLERVWKLQTKISESINPNKDFEILIHKTIKKITDDIINFNFNTAISAFMILLNTAEKVELSKLNYELFLKLLAPFAPHLTEEIWSNLGYKKSIHLEAWPEYDPNKLLLENKTVVIQINGKPRATLEVKNDAEQNEVETLAKAIPEVSKWIIDKKIIKVIFIKNKVLSIITD